MIVIKLDAINSTNSYLKNLCNKQICEDYTVVTAANQTNGRGQMGSVWQSQAGKNLAASVFKDVSWLQLQHQFYISVVTSLALVKTLEHFSIPKLHIKWPNDILSENKKICGILIENVIKQERLTETIIGIGLNVNQTEFSGLPNASSLLLISGTVFNTEEILHKLVENLKHYFEVLKSNKHSELKAAYESYLFRKNKPSTFKNIEGELFSGFIKSVTDSGNLCVLLEDEIIKEFDLKEIELLY